MSSSRLSNILFPRAPRARRRRIFIYTGLFLTAYWAIPLYQFIGKDIVDGVRRLLGKERMYQTYCDKDCSYGHYKIELF